MDTGLFPIILLLIFFLTFEFEEIVDSQGAAKLVPRARGTLRPAFPNGDILCKVVHSQTRGLMMKHYCKTTDCIQFSPVFTRTRLCVCSMQFDLFYRIV